MEKWSSNKPIREQFVPILEAGLAGGRIKGDHLERARAIRAPEQ